MIYKAFIYLFILCLISLLLFTSLVVMSNTDKITKLEKAISDKPFTVICEDFKYRDVTLNYEGYNCVVLGGTHE